MNEITKIKTDYCDEMKKLFNESDFDMEKLLKHVFDCKICQDHVIKKVIQKPQIKLVVNQFSKMF